MWSNARNWWSKLVKLSTTGNNPCFTKCDMIVTYHFPDRRIRDTHNLTKCLLDSLVEAKIIIDDNYMVLNTYTEKGVYDKIKSNSRLYIKRL